MFHPNFAMMQKQYALAVETRLRILILVHVVWNLLMMVAVCWSTKNSHSHRGATNTVQHTRLPD